MLVKFKKNDQKLHFIIVLLLYDYMNQGEHM